MSVQIPLAPSPEHCDLLVIGAGQGGGPLAGAFARAGKHTILVERTHVGGTCINEGCSPTKTIIASARVASVVRRARDYGVLINAADGTGPLVDLTTVRARKQHIVDSFRGGSERSLANAGVNLVRGHARFIGPREVEITLAGDAAGGLSGESRRRIVSAETVVINTGLRPTLPALPGLNDVPFHTSTSILDVTSVPAHLIVLGGGYVGLEFAQAFRRFGSRVTIVQRGDQLLPREDKDVADAVATILAEDGIDVVCSAEAIRVERYGDGVRLIWSERRRQRDASGHRAVENEISGSDLLVATGRTPNTDDLGLALAGVETDARGFVKVTAHLETTTSGVYAIGDVNGGPAFTHISYDDFRILKANLLDGGNRSTEDRLVPYTVFIDPQLGAVGMTEREARASGRRIKIAKLPMTSVARALETDETRGFMKVVVDADTGQILGAVVLGMEGGEIATILQVAMMGKLHYQVLRDAVFSHPTVAEALNNLFAVIDRA